MGFFELAGTNVTPEGNIREINSNFKIQYTHCNKYEESFNLQVSVQESALLFFTPLTVP